MLGWLPENLNVQGNIKDNIQGQGQGLAVLGRDQELETQDPVRGQLASRVLEAKAMSLRTPYPMCIKGVLRTVHCLQYCTVHHLFHDKKIDWRIGGGPRTPRTPLGYAHGRYPYLRAYTPHMLILHTPIPRRKSRFQ